MFRRFLIIGVGGSGGKTARLLHRELRWRLQEVGWSEGMPDGWQFLQIDVPTEPDGDAPDLPEQLTQVDNGSYQALAVPNLRYRRVDENLIPATAGSALLESYVGWRPQPHDVRVPIEKGAGQFRTLGRILALSGASQIQSAIRSAIDRLSRPHAVPQLDRLSQAFGNDATNHQPPPIAIVISSIAGGSGAGMVSDVADILRAQGDTWCSDSIGFLFTSEIFRDLPELTKQGVEPNSLAALSEVLAGYWNNEAAGVEFEPLAQQGIVMGDLALRGVRYPFLIGRSNGDVDFLSQNQVYAAMGKTLAAFMTSATAQSSTIGYLQGQWSANATGITDLTGLKGDHETPFQSMGSASVSLGRDRFARYASQRLARSCVEHLLRAHWVGRKVPSEVRPEDALEEAIDAQLNWFVVRCGLDELGEHNNQVIDALRPTDRDDRLGRLRIASRQHVNDYAQDALNASEWARILLEDLHHREPPFVAEDDGALKSAAVQWIAEIQSRIESTVIESLARAGAEVTAGLLERLRSRINHVIADLDGEAQMLLRKAGQREVGVREVLDQFGPNLFQHDNPLIDRALGRCIVTVKHASEVRLRRLACTLLRDLGEKLVEPLAEAVRNGCSTVHNDEHPPRSLGASIVEAWPTGTVVPAGLRPAINERLIEEPSTFPQAFNDLVAATLGEKMAQRAERIAVGQVVTGTRAGGDPRELEQQPPAEDLELGEVLVRIDGWWPSVFAELQPPSAARYELRIGALDLLARAEAWVNRRDTAIGDHVHKSLRAYLTEGDDAGLLAQRRARFIEVLTAALTSAPPLIRVSNAMLSAVHGLTRVRLVYHFTELPFDQTGIKDDVLRVMRTLGVFEDQGAEDEVAKSFGTGPQQRVEIMTFFQAPLQPLVLDSVMRPIAQEWARRSSTEEGVRQFWTWRRARSLTDFVPVPPTVRRAMVTGWFVARLLGELTWSGEDFHPIAAYLPATKGTAAFPSPLLGPPLLTEKDLLPAVLESLPLAMVEANTRQSLMPLMPYSRLRELGDHAQKHLMDWIRHGRTPGGTTPIPRAWQVRGSTLHREEASSVDRKEAVMEYLEGRRRQYVDKLADIEVDRVGFFETPRHFELRHDYAHSFEELHRLVASVDIDDDEDDGD